MQGKPTSILKFLPLVFSAALPLAACDRIDPQAYQPTNEASVNEQLMKSLHFAQDAEFFRSYMSKADTEIFFAEDTNKFLDKGRADYLLKQLTLNSTPHQDIFRAWIGAGLEIKQGVFNEDELALLTKFGYKISSNSDDKYIKLKAPEWLERLANDYKNRICAEDPYPNDKSASGKIRAAICKLLNLK